MTDMQADVVGIGSIVLDRIYEADRILGPESKGMIRGSREVVGGVTLNHLAWAHVLGVRTGIFGRQGQDAAGDAIRSYLDTLGVDRSMLRTDGEGSSIAEIFVDPAGERCIYMHRAATATTTPAHIDDYFADYIRAAKLVTTEISQLPLPTVVRVMEIAADAGVPTVLDVDIPPSQATGEAQLGTQAEIDQALALATYLKPAGSAIRELFPDGDLDSVAEGLFARLKPHGRLELIAITDGARGCVLHNGEHTVRAAAATPASVTDTTGAGDAFLGGLIAGIRTGASLEEMGNLANACGAACVEQFGASPALGTSRARALELCQKPMPTIVPSEPSAQTPTKPSQRAVETIRDEVSRWATTFDQDAIDRAVELILTASADGARVHVTGIGKPEHVARYGASLLSSTGTPATFLHGTECVHGSAGQVAKGDVVIAISNSGTTAELLVAVETLVNNGAVIIAVTGNAQSPLAQHAAVTLNNKIDREGGPLGFAPMASIVVQSTIFAALSAELKTHHGITPDQYAKWHPGGALGNAARESSS